MLTANCARMKFLGVGRVYRLTQAGALAIKVTIVVIRTS